MNKIFTWKVWHIDEFSKGELEFIVVNTDLIKILDNLEILNQASFVNSFFRFVKIRDIEFV
jgi:hypothetical protein